MLRSEIEKGIETMINKSKVGERLKLAGLNVPNKPSFLIESYDIQKDWDQLKTRHGGVSNIPFTELGEYLDKWTSLISYARWQEAVADIRQTSSREIRDTIKKQLYTLQDGGREIREAMISTEQLYIQWEEKFLEDTSYYIAVKALRESYEYRANSISREITRRTNENNDAGRARNRGGA